MKAIMGAAGNVGSKVAEQLLDEGEEVRVLEHRRGLTWLEEAGAEVVSGDALEEKGLRVLFAGANAALVLLPENLADPDFIRNRKKISRAIAGALRAEGVGHVVAISAVGAARPDAAGPPGGLYGFEQDLGELPANVLVLRAAAYMDYLLAALPMIEAEKINGSAIGARASFPMVATQDVAQVAAAHLRSRDFSGHEVRHLLGPEDVTMAEATAAIGAHMGVPDLPYVQFSPDQVRQALQDSGMSREAASLLVDMQLALDDGSYFSGIERDGSSTTATTLNDFLDGAFTKEAV